MRSTHDNEDIGSIVGRISSISDFESGVGATQEDVDAGQRVLGIVLPMDYVEMVKYCGWLSFDANDIYGMGDSVPYHLDMVRTTLRERTVASPHIPFPLVPIMNDGFGNHYCLDTGRLTDGSCPVVLWDHEKPMTGQDCAASFTDFIQELIDDAVVN